MSSSEVLRIMYCKFCGAFREDGLYCTACGKSNDDTNATATSPNGSKPKEPSSGSNSKSKDIPHCTICHMPRAGHTCSGIPCENAKQCGKQRFHRFKCQQKRARSKLESMEGLPQNVITSSIILPTNVSPKRLAIATESIDPEEQKRDRDFVAELVQWLGEKDEYFKEKHGELVALQIASSTLAHVQDIRSQLKRLRKSVMGEQQPNDVAFLTTSLSNLANVNNLGSSLSVSSLVGKVFAAEDSLPKDDLSAEVMDTSKK